MIPNSENCDIKSQIIAMNNIDTFKGLKVVSLNIKTCGILHCVD